jgi:hypothetical protein
MENNRFARELESFVRKYPTKNWEIRKTKEGIYVYNPRRMLPVQLEGQREFANDINLDLVFNFLVLSAAFFIESGQQLTFDKLMQILTEPDWIVQRSHTRRIK